MYNDCMKKMIQYLFMSFVTLLWIGCFQITIIASEPDLIPPVITIEPYVTDYTDQAITVYASTNEGSLNVSSYTFTENGSFEFVATDLAGNRTTELVSISNIIKKLDAVQNFRIVSTNYNQIELGWDAVIGAQSYDVYQGTSSTTLVKVANVSTTQYKTNNLNFNQLFYFKVVPTSSLIKTTTHSNILNARTSLKSPENLIVSLSSNTSSNLVWNSVDGAQGYEISYAKGTSSTYSVLKTSTLPSTSHTGLSLNTNYSYRIRAFRLIGTTRIYGGYSSIQSIMTPPIAPTLKVVSKDESSLTLTWNSVVNATQYEIYLDDILFDTVNSNSNSYDITGLNIGQSYSLKMISLNGELKSSPSISVTGVPIPAAPLNLTFTDRNYNGFSLMWDTVINSTAYEIYRSTSPTGTFSLIGSTSLPQFTDTKASFNVTYYYKVRSISNLIKGSFSNSISAKTSLKIPSDLTLSFTSSSSTSLSWVKVEGAEGYEISFSKGLSMTYSVLRTVSSISTTHTGLSLNTKYNYRVRAYRLAGTTRIYSAYSDVKSLMTPPQAPTLKLVSKDANTLVLTWNSIQNATSYEIYQDNVHIDTINSLSKEITSLQLGQSYQFKVVALNGELRSTDSSSVTGIPIPAAPTELKILSKNYNGFELKWNPVINSSSYEIWRSTSLNGTYSLQTITSETQFIDTKALFNTTYFYKVRAIENSIKGSFSNTISDKTILLTPTNLSVSINLTTSSLSWNTVEGANGYEISYSKGTSTTYTILRSVTTLSTNHTGLTLNTVFNYRIRAYRMAGTTKVYSGYSEVKSIMTPPQAPTLKVVSKDASTLVLSWNSIQNATSYEIYQDNVLIDTINTLNKEITGLQIGQSYQYKIVTLNGELRSTASSVVTGTPIPRAPIELKMININYNNLSFSWSPVENATSYEVVRSTSLTGTYTLLSTVSETQFSDSKALFNTNYYYKVRAIVGLIKGDFSNSIQAKTSLQKPQSIQLAATSASSSKIAWLAVDGAQGYEISYARGTSTSFTVLRSVTTLITTHTGLILNSKYTYRIRAYRLVGTTRIYSSYSDNFVIDYNSTYVLPHLAGILGTSTSVDESKQKITDYLNSKKVGNIKFVIGDYRIGIGQIFNQTPDAMNPIHIYDLVTIYLSNS